jgi:hypothetical protein
MPHCTFIRENKVCGAPAYQDPCPACIAYARTLAERLGTSTKDLPKPISVNARPSVSHVSNGTPPKPAAVPVDPTNRAIDLLGYPKYRNLHNLVHHLWTKNVGGHQYDKHEWDTLEAMLDDIVRNGPGHYDPHAITELRQGIYDDPTNPVAAVPMSPGGGQVSGWTGGPPPTRGS